MYQVQICSFILLCLVYYGSWATDWFKNTDQQAQTAFEQKDYAKSAQLFTDPYQRGVALYRNGQYTEAIEAFTAVTSPETRLDAQYNLGNAYFQQGDYQKALAAYEQVLAERPTDEDAKHNLVLAKQSLKSQKQDSSANQSKKNTEQQQGEQSAQPNEEEVMAEVLLNRLEENPQRLLRNQFYLDAQRTEAPPPTQPW